MASNDETENQVEPEAEAETPEPQAASEPEAPVAPGDDAPAEEEPEPAETRMGSGKGSPEHWVAVVKPGRVMFELAGVPEPLAREAMRLAGHKLPVKTKFVMREGAGQQ